MPEIFHKRRRKFERTEPVSHLLGYSLLKRTKLDKRSKVGEAIELKVLITYLSTALSFVR